MYFAVLLRPMIFPSFRISTTEFIDALKVQNYKFFKYIFRLHTSLLESTSR